MVRLPDPDYLRRTFRYEGEAGNLIWLVREDATPQWNAHYSGKVAGTKTGGRLQVILNGAHFKGHRIIWKLIYGADPAGEIDHKDGNALNNRLENLRLATRHENARNVSRRAISGLKGVSLHRSSGLWRARLRAGNKQFCEYHETPELAHAAYCRLAREHHGEFARVA